MESTKLADMNGNYCRASGKRTSMEAENRRMRGILASVLAILLQVCFNIIMLFGTNRAQGDAKDLKKKDV